MMIGSIAKKRWAIEISHEFMNACAQIPVCTVLYERDSIRARSVLLSRAWGKGCSEFDGASFHL